jgi:DNA-binding protein WhiA
MRNFLNQIKTEANKAPQTELTNLLKNATGGFIRGYHLEFDLNDKAANDLCENLAAHDIFAHKYTGRVVIKDCESICNLLALAGLVKSLYTLNDEIALRSVVNTSNRRANCDTHNITRQIETAAAQVEKIRALLNGQKFKNLSPELQATARARVENPTATYTELSQILNITKSGLVHRLKSMLK